MARAATTSDAFNAVAEPRRRQIIDLLSSRSEFSVNDLVEELGLAQPAVSKHLGVLRRVGLVRVRKDGQHRHYALNPEELKPVHAWIEKFERFWTDHLELIKQSAEKLAREKGASPSSSQPQKPSFEPENN
jgi:DNA-binding transcriptional ArsR family regulator